MDTKEVKDFLVLADKLNYTEASAICATSPSTLSRKIMRLEQELCVKLFERDNRTVKLTQAGERFRQFAEQLTTGLMLLENDLKSLNRPLSGKIRLYCSVTASFLLLPQILNRFRCLYPEVEISLETGDAANALTKITSREADLAIAAITKDTPKDLLTISLAQIPLVFIAPRQIPPTWKKDPAKEELLWHTVPYIVPSKGELRKELDLWFQKKGISPNIYTEVSGNEAIVSMVALGLGIALVPMAVVEMSSIGKSIQIIDRPIDLQPFNVSLCVPEKKLKTQAIYVFVETAKTVV